MSGEEDGQSGGIAGDVASPDGREAADDKGLSPATVVAYLRDHPDFLSRHPDLLDTLSVPDRTHDGFQGGGIGGGNPAVVDFQRAMVERQRAENTRIRAQYQDLVATARSNLTNQNRVHQAVLALLTATHFDHLVETISTDLPNILDLDVVALCLEAADLSLLGPPGSTVRLLPQGTIADIFDDADPPILLRQRVTGDPRIYGEAAGLVASDVVLKLMLASGGPAGLLAFGSREPGAFEPGQGTELLSFLRAVLETVLSGFLLPPDDP